MKQEAIKTDVLTSDLDHLLRQYIQYLREIPEAHRPIWVEYNPEPCRNTYQFIAVTPTLDKEARSHLYSAETYINNLFRSKGIYIDTLVFLEDDNFQQHDPSWRRLYP
jgi:hypothetical protein